MARIKIKTKSTTAWATCDKPPTPEVLAALATMVELAYHKVGTGKKYRSLGIGSGQPAEYLCHSLKNNNIMVKNLMSFGNLIIASLYREWLDNAEAGKDFDAWLRKREVTLEDLQKWSEAEGIDTAAMQKEPGESCVLDFGEGMRHENAIIDSVERMRDGKVYYNLTVTMTRETDKTSSEYPVSFYNVASEFVK